MEIALSLLLGRAELLTSENGLVGTFVLAATATLVGLTAFTDLPLGRFSPSSS